MKDWKDIDKKVEKAFDNGEVLRADRATLDIWLVSLSGRAHEMMREQTPMLQRMEVLRHLTAVRLEEESQQRRDAQLANSSAAMQRHNKATRWIAVIGIAVSAVAAVLNWLKEPQPAPQSFVVAVQPPRAASPIAAEPPHSPAPARGNLAPISHSPPPAAVTTQSPATPPPNHP